MFFKLFLLFTIVPITELYLLIKVGNSIGAFNTVGIIFITATLGAYLARSQGFQALSKIQNSMREGRPPGDDLLSGLLVLIGGFTLLTPGFLTDFLGFTMLIPVTRAGYMRVLKKWIQQKLQSGNWRVMDL